MSTTDTPPLHTDIGTSVEVLRSGISSMFDLRDGTGIDGEYVWPYPPLHLAALAKASPEHARAIAVKAEGAFGRGVIGTGAETLARVCDGGPGELFTGLGMDLGTFGNAFLQIVTGSGGRIAQLRRLPAVTMSRYRAGFLQRVPLPNGERRIITFRPDEVLHLRDHSFTGRQYGDPEWIGAEGMLELTRAAVAYNAAFFENGAMPEYAVIFHGGQPSPDVRAQIHTFFSSSFKGADNSHRTMILHHNDQQKITFEKMTADVKDGDFLKLLDAARDRIVTAHGVPPRMLGIMAAGQLGGGGELTGQLFLFELLTLQPRRSRMMERIAPILQQLGLTASTPEEADQGAGRVAFVPLDLTPPDSDIPPLADLVDKQILSPEEAYSLLPLSVRPAREAERRSVTQKSASALDALANLLSRT